MGAETFRVLYLRRKLAAMHKCLLFISMLLLAHGQLRCQDAPINPDLLSKPWTARWIDMPGVAERDYGVYHFRKNFDLAAKPSSFIVHVSADNRYRLFVNGKSVCFGPARGDLYNWYFETIDIAPYLQAGKNIGSYYCPCWHLLFPQHMNNRYRDNLL